MKARIGIPLPTSSDFAYNDRCWPEYASCVRLAGAEAVRIALEDSPEQRRLIESCAGFVLPGSPADVSPARYGQAADAATAKADEAREACDTLVLEHAEASGKPVLAICFGLQFANVWRGGVLVQDLQPVPVNHEAGARVAVAHTVLVAGQSLLGGLLTTSEAPVSGQFRRLGINSSHHQAVAMPGDDLTIVARSSEDQVVEALEGLIGMAPFVGVQWHPERSFGESPASRALFTWVIMAALDAGSLEAYAERQR